MKLLVIRFVNLFLFVSTFFIRRNPRWIVFGSWMGRQYSDNPRYIYEYLMKLDIDVKLIWIGDELIHHEVPQSEKTIFVKKNSFRSIYYLLKCKYIFINQMAESDLSIFNLYRKTVITHCWHGVPLKRIGADMISTIDNKGNLNNNTEIIGKLKSMINEKMGLPLKYNYFVSSSLNNDRVFESAFAYLGAHRENIIPSGYPRNDMFFKVPGDTCRTLKIKICKLMGFSEDKKIVLYLPTYRRSACFIESFCDRNKEDIANIDALLNRYNAVLIEKNHFASYEQGNVKRTNGNGSLIKVQKEFNINVQELLLVSDVLISDYSGAFLDFSLLDRPIIHFAYDYDYYKDTDSGLYYDIADFSAGYVATNFVEVVNELDNILSGNDDYKEKRKHVREEFMAYENGHASEYICNVLFKQSCC